MQEFLKLDSEKSRTFFNLFHLPNDSDSFIIQFHIFFLVQMPWFLPWNSSKQKWKAQQAYLLLYMGSFWNPYWNLIAT